MDAFLHALSDASLDTLKALPILYLAYLLVAYFSHSQSSKFTKFLNKSKKAGPAVGAFLGCIPQCGFSSVMSDLYSRRSITLGTLIADVADYIIIMNEINKNYILSGAISHNFDKNKIYFCSNRKKQKELLQLLTTKNCVVLFENDLPDNYK